MSVYGCYVPLRILRGLNENGSKIEAGDVHKIFSIVMFLDISGFTALTEKYVFIQQDFLIVRHLHLLI
jgi:hypothetical protein